MKIILGKPTELLEDTETSDISPIVRDLLIEQCKEPELILEFVDVCREDGFVDFKASLV